MKALHLLSLMLLPWSLASADILNVRGPNPDFNQINPAIAAAADGDVIRVWAGNYSAFQLMGRSLTVARAEESGNVNVNGSIRIQNLIAGMEAVLSGIHATGTDDDGLIMANNQGAVRIRDCRFTGADATTSPYGEGGSGARILSSADVVFTDCEILCGVTDWGMPGLTTVSSGISMFDSTAEGSHGWDAPVDTTYDGDQGGSGVTVQNGFLYASGCTFRGGDGGDGGQDYDVWSGQTANGGNGGDGIYTMNASDLHLLDNTFLPGVGGLAGPGGYNGSPGEDVDLDAGSTREDLSGTARHLGLPAFLPEQTTVDITVRGEAGDLVLLVASESSRLRYISPAHGPLLLRSPFDMARQVLGVLPASGSRTFQLTVPHVPASASVTWHFQAGLLPNSGGLYLSSVSSAVLLDSGP